MSGNPHWFSRVAEHLEVNEDNFVDADVKLIFKNGNLFPILGGAHNI